MCKSIKLINDDDNLSILKGKHVVYQNKSAVSDLAIIYIYYLKVNHLSFKSQFFNTFMILIASYKAIEDIYSTILAIFIIFMTMQNLSDHLEN